jgi:hypothetical protein
VTNLWEPDFDEMSQKWNSKSLRYVRVPSSRQTRSRYAGIDEHFNIYSRDGVSVAAKIYPKTSYMPRIQRNAMMDSVVRNDLSGLVKHVASMNQRGSIGNPAHGKENVESRTNLISSIAEEGPTLLSSGPRERMTEGGEVNIVVPPHLIICTTSRSVQVVTTESATATLTKKKRSVKTCAICKRSLNECPGANNRAQCKFPQAALPIVPGAVPTRVVTRTYKVAKPASCKSCGKTNTQDDKNNGTGCLAATKGSPDINCIKNVLR